MPTAEETVKQIVMAMCQACHLAYDRDHHADTRRARQEQ